MTTRSLIVLAMLSLAPAAALAEDPASTSATAAEAGSSQGKGKRWQACAAELQKFCATIEKGKGLRRACLESHAAELSEGCKTNLAERAARAKAKSAE
jgi:hypothetical protein